MTVYVDDMHTVPLGRYRKMKMSHMIADSLDELHLMADKIGVDRRWYQGPPKTRVAHYDICLSKRGLAVKHGAVEITMSEAGRLIRSWREQAATMPRSDILP